MTENHPHEAPRTPGGNNLSNIDKQDIDRVIPKPGEAVEKNPDKTDAVPDDDGNPPRPL